MPEKPDPADFPPPEGLSARSQELWREVVPKRAISAGRLAMIEEALRARDRADQAAAVVDAEGLLKKTETTGATHLNPAAKAERENRQLFTRLWSGMHLDWSVREDGQLGRN